MLLTDLYELRMAASYLRRDMAVPATFSLFVRELPPNRGFLVAAGLEDCLAFLEDFGADRHDRAYLRTLPGFASADVRALAQVRFSGDVWAVPEGTIVFENEPLLEVTAPIAEAQLVETYLLNQVTFQTTIATKAARCRLAAQERMLVDFAFRRTHGVEAAMAVARAAAIAGFAATSNVEAARRFGLTASGTMAHSYVEAFASEDASFTAFIEDFPDRPTFLVDTYNTEAGVSEAIRVATMGGLGDRFSVRLDSGDIAALSRRARKLLDDAGCHGARIVVSGSLDEYEIDRLLRGGAPIDAFGVGTKMGVSADAPSLDTAYKLVAYGERPVIKLSAGKATLPGAKQVFRNLRVGADVLGLRDEQMPDREPLLQQVMAAGERSRPPDTLEAMRARVDAGIAQLPAQTLQLSSPPHTPVAISDALAALRDRCAAEATAGVEAPWPANGIESADDPRIVAATTVVTVRDGTRIRIRPVVIGDSAELARGFERLSPESRARRFIVPPSSLSESMLRYFTTIDYVNHMALGAFAIDDPGEPGVAVARYVRLHADPGCAEAAITVLDDYQGRGIGSALIEAMALIALSNGIDRFCGFVQWENTDALELARFAGATVRQSSRGMARIDVPLAPATARLRDTPLKRALQALARREVALVADPETDMASVR